MKKERFYTLIIIVLLLLNLGTLGYLWKTANNTPIIQHGPPHEKPGAYIVRSLELDKQQEKDFHVLGRNHKKQLDSIHKTMEGAQAKMFELIGKGELNELEKDSLLQVIKDAEGAKQVIITTHFSDVRKILKPNQLPLFEQLMQEIGEHLGRPIPEGRGHRPPPPRH